MIEPLDARRLLTDFIHPTERFVHLDGNQLVVRADRLDAETFVGLSRLGDRALAELHGSSFDTLPLAAASFRLDEVKKIVVVGGRKVDHVELSARLRKSVEFTNAQQHDDLRGSISVDWEAPPGGVVRIDGRDTSEAVLLTVVNGDLVISSHPLPTNSIGAIEVAITTLKYDVVDVSRIEVNGNGGNDAIRADGTVFIPMLLTGGTGNDTLTGGYRDDVIQGGEGNDSLFGGNGSDLIQGGGGDDRLNDNTPFDSRITFIGGSDPADDLDTLAGDSGRDTFQSGQGDYINGGRGSDFAVLVGAPESVDNVETLGSYEDGSYVKRTGTTTPKLNLYRDDRGHLILQIALTLSDSGWAVDWDLEKGPTGIGAIAVSATTYYSGGGYQAITTYAKNFDLGKAPSGAYDVRASVNGGSPKRQLFKLTKNHPGSAIAYQPYTGTIN